MKRLVKSVVNSALAPFGVQLSRVSADGEFLRMREMALNPPPSTAAQMLLSLRYQDLLANKLPLPRVADTGYRIFSQSDEDGILLFLFSVLRTTSKLFVEIGAGRGDECNAANLAINFGWYGLFIDGNPDNVAYAQRFYERNPDTRYFPPKFVCAMVTRENVNQVITDAGIGGEIDLLSIDIDGMEYWIWEAISSISPRVVVIEANGKFGTRSITVPYDPAWVYDQKRLHYHGASLPAMVKLARRKGYRLVGTIRYGFNAFFVRNDIGPDALPSVTVESCRTHPTRKNDEKFFAPISQLPFVEV